MPGDGILLYPGKEHVLPSIRLANIRDGEEDYEYLVMAEERIGREKTAAMVRQYVRSPTQFTRDAASLAALRDQLADAITSDHPIKVADCGIITTDRGKSPFLSRVFREDVHSRGDKAGSRKGRKTP